MARAAASARSNNSPENCGASAFSTFARLSSLFMARAAASACCWMLSCNSPDNCGASAISNSRTCALILNGEGSSQRSLQQLARQLRCQRFECPCARVPSFSMARAAVSARCNNSPDNCGANALSALTPHSSSLTERTASSTCSWMLSCNSPDNSGANAISNSARLSSSPMRSAAVIKRRIAGVSCSSVHRLVSITDSSAAAAVASGSCIKTATLSARSTGHKPVITACLISARGYDPDSEWIDDEISAYLTARARSVWTVFAHAKSKSAR